MAEPVTISGIIGTIAEVILEILKFLGKIESLFGRMPGTDQQTIMRMQRGEE